MIAVDTSSNSLTRPLALPRYGRNLLRKKIITRFLTTTSSSVVGQLGGAMGREAPHSSAAGNKHASPSRHRLGKLPQLGTLLNSLSSLPHQHACTVPRMNDNGLFRAALSITVPAPGLNVAHTWTLHIDDQIL
jgi:hypothetical protein